MTGPKPSRGGSWATGDPAMAPTVRLRQDPCHNNQNLVPGQLLEDWELAPDGTVRWYFCVKVRPADATADDETAARSEPRA